MWGNKPRWLCKLGLHKWKEVGFTADYRQNYVRCEYDCVHCGKRKVKTVGFLA